MIVAFRYLFENNGYAESFHGVGYQDLDLVRRLEALVEHRFGNDLVSAPSFKQRCHETGGDFFMLEFEIKDSSYSIPQDPEQTTRSNGACLAKNVNVD